MLRALDGAGAPVEALPVAWPVRFGSELEAGADVHHRSATRADRPDDLLGIDALQVHARRGHIRMPEVTLDDRQRHPLPREFDSVRMAELMRREPTAAHRPRARIGAAPRVRRSRTTAARGSAHRSRRTARRPATQPSTRATARGDRSRPMRPSRLPGACCPSPGEPESRRGADRDLTRSTTALPGSVDRRATARRSAREPGSRADRTGSCASRRRSRRPSGDPPDRPSPCCEARAQHCGPASPPATGADR